jgi:outer membrane receptor protein involved in Fe transport
VIHQLHVLVPRLIVCFLLVPSVVNAAAELANVSGTVRDASGAGIGGAEVALLDARRVIVRTVTTNAEGQFKLPDVPAARYILLVTARAQAPHQQIVEAGAGGPIEVAMISVPGALTQDLVVTAAPGVVQDESSLSQPVNVIDTDEIALRAHSVTAQVAAEEPGLHLQRTSPSLGGIFVRGFTGNKVNVFLDGVRYSTGAMRGGINTFLNLIDPSFLSGVEVLRGPNSAQYGSDAIGGSLQFFSRSPSLVDSGSAWGGAAGVNAGSADESGGVSVAGNYASSKFGLAVTVSGRRINDLRPGDGIDSHNAVTRFFGLPSTVVIDERLPDTSFTQGAGTVRFEWAPTPNGRLVGAYLHGRQEGGKRYDQLIGGDGNLVADLLNVNLDFAYLKYDWAAAGWFDNVSVGYSFSSQSEERVNQGGNGNPAASINHEPERTKTNGLQALLTKFTGRNAASFGADLYYDQVHTNSYGVNPTTGAVSIRRGRVPDGATFLHGGVFAQDVFEVLPGRLTINGSLRWGGAKYEARAADSPLVGGVPLWPDDDLRVSSLTFRAGAAWTVAEAIQVTGNVSRGFRAPHITDLGTLGLTGAGFEVAAPDVAGLGAEIGSTADSTAVSTGRPVKQLSPETSMTYETGLRVDRRRFQTHAVVFLTDVSDNIAKQTLILPQGAVGLTLGDQTITSQNANGAVFVAASTNPVLVRANFDDARVVGVEYSLSAELARGLRFSTIATYLRAEDRATGLPPNIEGGTPPPEIYVLTRYTSPSRRYWVEPYVHAAAKQTRISSLDLGDRRTGAGRSVSSIASFFNNGARARGLIGNGVDAVPNTSDDILLATGETLAEVQARVLGPTLASAPLYSEIPGYVTVGVRGGFNAGRHTVLVDFDNISDENYRGPSWGVDAPGRGLYVSYRVSY